MDMTLWDAFRKEYSKRTKLPEWAIDFLAIREIIFLHLSGYSNRTIAKKLKLPIWYVSESIFNFLYYEGWEENLEYNSFPLYDENYEQFYYNVVFSTWKLNDALIKVLYSGISKYKKAERLVEQYD